MTGVCRRGRKGEGVWKLRERSDFGWTVSWWGEEILWHSPLDWSMVSTLSRIARGWKEVCEKGVCVCLVREGEKEGEGGVRWMLRCVSSNSFLSVSTERPLLTYISGPDPPPRPPPPSPLPPLNTLVLIIVFPLVHQLNVKHTSLLQLELLLAPPICLLR